VLLIAITVAFVLTPQYRATAAIILQSASLPQTMVQSTVVQDADFREHAAEQLELLRRKVLSSDSLQALVKKYDPYPQSKDDTPSKAIQLSMDTTIEAVDPITLQSSDKSPAFAIYYLNPSIKRAGDVSKMLVQMFMDYNQESRVRQATQALQFLQT